MKCPHALSGFSRVYRSKTSVASPYFPALNAASPSANDAGPTIVFAGSVGCCRPMA